MIAEDLFYAEAKLREAAENYTAWTTASNRTPKILNDARLALRAAAIAYANAARQVHDKKRGGTGG